jgi:hypothetical protein
VARTFGRAVEAVVSTAMLMPGHRGPFKRPFSTGRLSTAVETTTVETTV